MSAPSDDALQATAELLDAVFGEAHLASTRYLDWLYRENPAGPVIATDLEDSEGLSAHYAVIPVELSLAGRASPAALSLNTAVHERARGGGVFTRLAEDTYGTARDRGIAGIVGVANANSTPGFLRRLEFTHVGSLRAAIIPRVPGTGRRITTTVLDPAAPSTDAAVERLTAAFELTDADSAVRWASDALRWRLETPRGPYVLHEDDHGNAILSVLTQLGRIRAAAILAVLPRSRPNARAALRLAQAACRHHRALLAVHVDVPGRRAMPGVPLPGRLKPSPLNLIWRPLDPTVAPAPTFTCFEFLDFDAY